MVMSADFAHLTIECSRSSVQVCGRQEGEKKQERKRRKARKEIHLTLNKYFPGLHVACLLLACLLCFAFLFIFLFI